LKEKLNNYSDNEYLKTLLLQKDKIIAEKEKKNEEKDKVIKDKDKEIKKTYKIIEKNNRKIEKLLRSSVSNTININICAFGKEPQIEREKVIPLLKMPADAVPKYIKMKHFDENGEGNVKILNERGKFIQVLEEDTNGIKRWVKRDKNKTISDMTELNLDELIEKYNAQKVVFFKHWYEACGLNKEGFDKRIEWRQLLRQVELLFLNHRATTIPNGSTIDSS
jgi:hypothetical protein